MNLSIEPFLVNTGFVYDSGVSFELENEHREYIASDILDKSLMFKWDINSSDKSVTKTFGTPIDVSEYKEVVFSIWSRKFKNNGVDMRSPSDFKYKISFGTAEEFYIPINSPMTDVTLALGSITSISQIKITALHDVEDYLILSNMLAVVDELPLDIFNAIKLKLDDDFKKLVGDGIEVGTVGSASANDTFVEIGGDRYFLGKYATVKIKDGSNEEIIQLYENDEKNYKLSPIYNGGKLVNSYTNAKIYLQFDVRFGVEEDEISLPSVTIWGMVPNPVLRNSRIEKILDTYKVDKTVTERQDTQVLDYSISLDLMARHDELSALMGQIIRPFLAKQTLHVNGRRFKIDYDGNPVELDPIEAVNKLTKIQYNMVIEVNEEIDERITLVNTSAINTSFNIN